MFNLCVIFLSHFFWVEKKNNVTRLLCFQTVAKWDIHDICWTLHDRDLCKKKNRTIQDTHPVGQVKYTNSYTPPQKKKKK